MSTSPRFKAASQAWLERANSNLARAKADKPEGVFWEDLCFDAQQAAEKAFCIYFDKRFPYNQNIGDMIAIIESISSRVPKEVVSSSFLTDYAVATRFPSFGPAVTEQEYRSAVKSAEAVYRWVEQELDFS